MCQLYVANIQGVQPLSYAEAFRHFWYFFVGQTILAGGKRAENGLPARFLPVFRPLVSLANEKIPKVPKSLCVGEWCPTEPAYIIMYVIKLKFNYHS